MAQYKVSLGKDKLIDKCDALYILHKDAIYRMAFSAVGGNKEWALKLLEECMIAVCENIEKFGDEKSLDSKAKMVAILLSLINKIYAEVWQKMGVFEEAKVTNVSQKERFDVDQILIRNELTTVPTKYVEKLTNAEKELVFMRFFMGLSLEELSKQYKATPDEIEKKIFMVKKRIVNMIKER